MIILATILDNPGEPLAETRYRNPHELRALGYTDLAIYQTTGLSGLMGPETVNDSDIHRWLEEQYENVEKTAAQALSAGMGVWLTVDAPSLANELVTDDMLCQDGKLLNPASDALLDAWGRCLEALVHRFNPIAGIILRLGDNDAHRLPYLKGNDIYSPGNASCPLSRVDRLSKWINRCFDIVVNQMGKRLIVRGWNLKPGGLHDNPELCRQVMDKIPDDQRLILSFKFTETDFWRYQQWNQASLVCGHRPVIYELECQREYEGKGAIPNFQLPLWQNGMPEAENSYGLVNLPESVNLAGLWSWVRGGGWGGPFISDEVWIDINAYCVPKIATNFNSNPESLVRNWLKDRFQCEDEQAVDAILHVLNLSTEAALKTFYIGPYAKALKGNWHPSGDFIQDDQLEPEKLWQIVKRLPEERLDDAAYEKQEAVEMLAEARRAVQQHASHLNQPHGHVLIHTLEYAESLASTIRHLIIGLVAYRRFKKSNNSALAKQIIDRMFACQQDWNHHTQRIASYPGTATAFRSDDLWNFIQQLIDKMHSLEH